MFKILKHKALYIILFLSLIIRLGYGLYLLHINGTSHFGDDWDYISYAEKIIKEGIFFTDLNGFYDETSHQVGPGFPLIVASVFFLFGKNYLAFIILNAIFSSLITLLIYLIAKEFFNKRVAIFSSIWSIFYFPFIRYTANVLKENFLIFFVVLILYYFLHYVIKKSKTIHFIIFAFLYSFLIHTDERYVYLLPVFTIFLLIYHKNSLPKLITLILAISLFSIPWLIRNYYAYNKIVFLTVRTTTFTDKIFNYESSDYLFEDYYNAEISQNQIDSIKAGYMPKNINPKAIRDIQKGLSMGLSPHQFSPCEKIWSNFKMLCSPFILKPFYYASGFSIWGPNSKIHNIILILNYGILIPFFLIGIYVLIREKNKTALLFSIIILMHILTHILLIPYVRYRYRIPVDPLIIIISFYGVFWLVAKIKSFSFLKLGEKT